MYLKNFIKYAIDAILIKLKGKKYVADPAISNRDILLIFFHRFPQLIRGLILKVTLKSDGIIFCGKNVKFQFKYKINTGKNLIIEDGVFINALSKNGILIGDDVTLGRYANIIGSGVIRNLGIGLRLGDNSSIGAFSHIGCQGEVEIGDFVIMGPYVKIFSENHNIAKSDIPFKLQGETRQKVTIGDNCWIGSGTIILAGVTIGCGVVIAAGSVVTKNFGDNVVVGGVPAKVLKTIS